MAYLLSLSRYTVLFGVVASLLISVMIFVASLIRSATSIIAAATQLADPKTAKQLAVVGIEVADLVLIGTVLYIIATGLYELFIGDVKLPSWISVTSLDDLKNKLLSVSVAVLIVTFLIQIVNWDQTTNLLPFGAAIAAVVLALTAFMFVSRGAKADGKPQPMTPSKLKDDGSDTATLTK